jgi:hypothetical protein
MMPEQGGNGVARRPYVRRSGPRARTLVLIGRRLLSVDYTYGPSGEVTGQERRLDSRLAKGTRLLKRSLPATRADCENGERPCPYVSCRHHLCLDVSKGTGSIKLNFPQLEPGDMKESCSLDVAARGGATLEEVGAAMNLTRERCRQVEVRGMAKMKRQGVPSPAGSED